MENTIVNKNGQLSSVTGKKAMNIYAVRTVMIGIKLYLETGMQPNRAYTPQAMRNFAEQQTGEKYARSRKGLEAAMNGLKTLLESAELFDGVKVINENS